MSGSFDAVVIGASAGAVEALSKILPQLPMDYALPILIVVHMPPDKKSVLAEVMQEKCKIKVREAEDKDRLEAGCVYFAPPDYHMLIEAEKTISLTVEEQVMFSRPSIDVMFESAADIFGEKLLGILLTGANADGAAGLRRVMDEGGRGIVQSPDEAFARAMPDAGLKACPEAVSLNLEQIVAYLLKEVRR